MRGLNTSPFHIICKHRGSDWTCTYFFNGLVKNFIPDSLVPTRAIIAFIETQQILTVDFNMSLGLRCEGMMMITW